MSLLIPFNFKLHELYFVLEVLVYKAVRLLAADWFDYFALGHEVKLAGIKPRVERIQDAGKHLSGWSWLLEYRSVLISCVKCSISHLLHRPLFIDRCSGRLYDSLWIICDDLDRLHFILGQRGRSYRHLIVSAGRVLLHCSKIKRDNWLFWLLNDLNRRISAPKVCRLKLLRCGLKQRMIFNNLEILNFRLLAVQYLFSCLDLRNFVSLC